MQILINGEGIFESVKSNAQMRELFNLDKQIAHIKKTNPKKYAQLLLLVALIIPHTTLASYAMAMTTGSTISIGVKAYEMGKQVAQAICLIGWLTEGIKCVITGTVDGLSKVSIKWISFALMIKFLPSVVDWIFSV